MTKNYYRSEYSNKQWKALIDKATELGCQITYSKYGNIVTIDSTDRESRIIATTGRGEQDRAVWAERIHGMIQESTIKFTVRDPEVTRGRWQEIRYSKRNGYAYIVKYGKRLYLHKFLRIY